MNDHVDQVLEWVEPMTDLDGTLFGLRNEAGDAELFYFTSWSGLRHPLKPVGPLSALETLRQRQFYTVRMQRHGEHDRIAAIIRIQQSARRLIEGMAEGEKSIFMLPVSPENGLSGAHETTLFEVMTAQFSIVRATLLSTELFGIPEVDSPADTPKDILPSPVPNDGWALVTRREDGGFLYSYDEQGRMTDMKVIPRVE